LLWLLFAVAGFEVFWQLDRFGWASDEWKYAGLLALCATFLLLVWQLSRRGHWAAVTYPGAYWILGPLPALVLGAGLLVGANLLDGRLPGWPYIPFINPIEQAATFALLMAVIWQRGVRRLPAESGRVDVRIGVMALALWWGNGLLVRTFAMLGDVPWQGEALWGSALIQASMAIAWTVAALVCMAVSNRRANREAWFAGAFALGVVVVKLFLVDSARGGGLARAVAFIGVALLILLIGYLAPLPPRLSSEGKVSS
jgi:uncharacterized membrane protein